MPIKSFRGLVADTGQDTISLHTNDGSTGYRVVKLQVIPQNVTTTTNEVIVKIYSRKQTSATATIDFSDQTLLGVAFWSNHADTHNQSEDYYVIFDNEIFNQDIYLTMVNVTSADPVSYYMELEQIKLGVNQNTVATLKDMRDTGTGS
jgi:hypothetical protein